MALPDPEREPIGMEQFKTREERVSGRVLEVTGGTMVEAIAGVGAVVLACLGLAAIYPLTFLPVAGIVAGAALFFAGGMTVARFYRFFTETAPRAATEWIGGGANMEALAGIAGIVLSILALIGQSPLVLMPVSAIVFGSALLLSAGGTARMNAFFIRSSGYRSERTQNIVNEGAYTTSGLDVLVGLGSIILGILALAGYAPLTLSLIAILAVGGAVLIGSSAVMGKITWARIVNHTHK